MTPAEQIERMSQVPLAFQPGTMWHYSLASDVLGRVWSRLRASGSRTSWTSACSGRSAWSIRLSGCRRKSSARLAESLEKDRFAGRGFALIDVSAPPNE
jgi:hypothetical protein